MELTSRLAIIFASFAFLLLCAIVVFQFIENRSMRNVLINHTMSQIEAQFDEARAAEKEQLTALSTELDEILDNLSTIQGLKAEERDLIKRGIAVTDTVLSLTKSRGLEY